MDSSCGGFGQRAGENGWLSDLPDATDLDWDLSTPSEEMLRCFGRDSVGGGFGGTTVEYDSRWSSFDDSNQRFDSHSHTTQLFDLCGLADPTQVIQCLQNIPIDQKHEFVVYRDREGRTALFVAAEKGGHQVVEMLLTAGVDKNAVRNDGATPIFAAAENG